MSSLDINPFKGPSRTPRPSLNIKTSAGNNQEALTMTDLETNSEYLETIRDYMIDRKGKQFVDMEAEDVVDAFTKHMRFFNVNEAVTLSEGIYISKADQDKKKRAGEAYKLYDKLGNVFVNDGLSGAVDGVFDYISAIATSPSTYFGLGAGKLVSMAGGKAATQAVKKQAQLAYKNTFKQSGKEAAKKAFNSVVNDAAKTKAYYAAGLTGVADLGVAVDQDIRYQNVLMEGGARDEYDPFQTLFSAAGAGIGTGLAMSVIPKTKDKTDITGIYKRTKRARFKTQLGVRLTNEQRAKFSNRFIAAITKAYKNQDKYQFFRGEAFEGEKFFAQKLAEDINKNGKVPVFSVDEAGDLKVKELTKEGGKLIEKDKQFFSADLLQAIIGNKADGTYILDIAKEAGISLPSGMNQAGQIASLLRDLDEDALLRYNQMVYNRTGIHLGDVADSMARNLSAGVSRSIQNFAQGLVAVQGSALNSSAALVKGNVKHQVVELEAVAREVAEGNIEKRADIAGYVQNTWKRLLVSAPPTTAANVFGWGQYYTANSVAELFQAGTLGVLGLARGAGLTEASKRDLTQALALGKLQSQKLKNFFDPYTTFNTYLEVLEGDPKLKRKLLETFAGGVERTADRFDINEANVLFRATEGYVDIANRLSGVKLQDSVTKSQMFITSIDKQLRLQKNITFSDAIEKGDFSELTNDVVDAAMDETLKSVFAKDYTKRLADRNIFDMPGSFGSYIARFVEDASNTPGFGFVLPFGRFMNNVVATAYQWNPVTGLLPFMGAAFRGQKLEATEAFGKAMVGAVGIKLAMDFQAQSEAKGLAWNELETGSGDVTDITNMFPFSLWMAGGRYMNTIMRGGETKELRADFLKQIAIGQTVTDLQFGNDLTKMFAAMEGLVTQGDGDVVKNLFEGMAGGAGNVFAGFTRPFDSANRLIGAASGMDTAIDRRQAEGAGKLTVNASRYVDNIIETLRGRLMGEELSVGIREGEIYDPSPLRSITGVRMKQPRTSANIVFGMVNFPEWKVSMYSGIPEHDAFVNRVMTPLLEQESELLLKNKKFKDASLAKKRLMADQMLSNVKGVVTDVLTSEPTSEDGLNYRRKLLDRKKNTLMKEARKITGITKPLRDLSLYEVELLETATEIVKDELKERGD